MGVHIYKSHNKTLLLYHLVFPLKYRKKVITEEIGEGLKEICIEISERYEINFVEIGYEEDHVHFLIQSVPSNSVEKMIRAIKSITAKELFKRFPEIKQKLWGGNFGQVDIMQIQLVNMQMKRQLENMLKIRVSQKKSTRKFTQIN